MAETIDPKTGVATSASTFDDILEAIAIHGDAATHGVVPGMLNELEVTGVLSPVAVDTGWAIVKGKLFRNTTSKNVVVASPLAATRIDRVVVLIDYTASPETGTITLIGGVEGGAAPDISAYQVDGTSWALPLAQLSITTGGVITVTDERKELLEGQITEDSLAADCVSGGKIQDDAVDSEHIAAGAIDLEHMSANSVDSDQYVDGSVDTVHIGDSQVTAQKIANRTRIREIPCTFVYNMTDGLPINRSEAFDFGWPLTDGKKVIAWGSFYVPSDYVSDGVVIPVVYAAGTGDMYAKQSLWYAATGETPTEIATALATEAMTNTQVKNCTTLQTAFGAIAAGDHVMVQFERDADHGSDTVGAYCQISHWLLSYTADS